MELSVTLTGLQPLLRSLTRDLPEAVQLATLRRVLPIAAEPIRSSMAVLAPRGPQAPHLADSMRTKLLGPGELEAVTDDTAGVEIGPLQEFFYGYFFEFGTVKLAARPFARPAFDHGQGPALRILERELWTAIQRALKEPAP